MAGKQVNFDVNVDSSDAVKGLRDFSRAAQKAGKDAAKGLDDAATAGDKARSAITAMAEAMDTELRGAAQAAEALGKALGPELAGKMDVNQVVVDLNKMGVTFDEIRLEADQFATTLKQVDDIRLQQTNAGLDNMKTKLDGVRNNADQSRSVLANMAGNSAQDLGELGGVAGTAGVAIGQLAEYATEGNISLSAFAKVAGPMAGLAAATIIASNAMKFFQQDSKRSAEAVEAMNEAIIAGEDPLEAYTELLKEQGGILAGQRDQGVKELITDVIGLTGATEDLTPSLLAAGVTIDTWNTALEGGEAGRQAFVDGLTQMREEGRITQSEWYSIVNAFGDAAVNFDTATRQAGEAAQFFVTTQQDLNDILAASADPLTKHTELWDALIRDVADGTFNFENAADAVTILADATGLTTEQIVELVKQKADEHILEIAEAEEEAAAEALRLNQAIADLGDTMATIDTDDFANISGALESEFNKVDDILAGLKFDVDFQPALNEALDGLRGFGPDFQTLADEWANILEGKPIDIFGNVRADDAEFQEKLADLTNLFQEGVVNAFDQGGVEAANTFVQSTAAQIAASTGLSIAEVYRIMGLPPDGSVDMLIKPMVDAEAKADALAILDALIGVSPDNPRLAYIRLAVQTGDIDPQVAEIAARLLAAEALQVPAELEGFTQADIDAATALISGAPPIPVPVEIDDGGTVDDFANDADEATEDRTTQVIVPKSDSLGAMQILIDHVARAREVAFNAKADNAGAINSILNAVARRRDAPIYVTLPNIWDAEQDLATLARRRDAYIVTHVTGGAATPTATTTAGPTAGTLAVGPTAFAEGEDAPEVGTFAAATMSPVPSTGVAIMSAAPASTVNNNYVTVQAGIVGNKNEMDRLISKALRRHIRLNGSRN